MVITEKDLQNVATLSRLQIAEDERAAYREDLRAFLEYVENLKALDTEAIKPTTYALPMQNVFREDVVKPSLPREAALQNAPLQEDGYFKVPRILD